MAGSCALSDPSGRDRWPLFEGDAGLDQPLLHRLSPFGRKGWNTQRLLRIRKHPLYGEIVPERSEGKVRPPQPAAPPLVMSERAGVRGLMDAAVDRRIGLPVAIKVQPPE